jgi:hypothetical protein
MHQFDKEKNGKRRTVEEEGCGRVKDQYRKATHKTTTIDNAGSHTQSGAVPDERIKTMRPTQNMLAASSDSRPSGSWKSNCSWAMTPVE